MTVPYDTQARSHMYDIYNYLEDIFEYFGTSPT